ncbi:hypothetical protein AB44_5475 [Escherichia coli 3-073-06_S1_C2]|nr:hypothetical protein EC180050_2189 [Escherichia coli 180050]ENH19583.1 hypothetical protein ECP030230813_2044 [Escherichia coli P0302308.13]KDT88506.1 hypothetical protein AB20_2239 [Escherichia coli 3-475-03_S1_C1]KDW49078.1 hypothetical protein AB82_5328 [Escherichia coli 2-005-03_S3_C1]KDW61397.1 hypothetical protein AC40_5431 [Escherichia coli 2-005-03_S3_C3]KDZ54195.1 hypothetical protein AB44_5475 [Escherichia coli 3-073-06_S1_C2]
MWKQKCRDISLPCLLSILFQVRIALGYNNDLLMIVYYLIKVNN